MILKEEGAPVQDFLVSAAVKRFHARCGFRERIALERNGSKLSFATPGDKDKRSW